MTPSYRTDIDCLRALAVLSVFAFHLEIKRFGGGFVGVDIFFVISGYLISRIIIEEVSDGTFSFATFYERRVRRILPALYAMLAMTTAVAWVVLLPTEFRDLLKTLLATIGLSSNIWFWLKTGYFEGQASEKPLLHTWSLSVEEQFYLVFPLVLWLIARAGKSAQPVTREQSAPDERIYRWPAIVAVIGATSLSFAFSQWLLARAPEASFYMAPSRAGEFLIGTLLVLIRSKAPLSRLVQTVMALAGAGLMLFAILRFRASNPFPGWRAAVPCLGAALVIHAFGRLPMGGGTWPSTRIALFFGRISYSLYLWHWPVILFAPLLLSNPGGLTPADRIIIFIIALTLSVLSYWYVEQPVRTLRLFRDRTNMFAVAATASAVLIAIGLAGLTPVGIQREMGGSTARLLRYNAGTIGPMFSEASCFMLPNQTFEALVGSGCLAKVSGKRHVLLWGDSAAAHYARAVREILAGSNTHLLQTTASSCPPTSTPPSPFASPGCHGLNRFVRDSMPALRPDGIVLSAHWRHHIATPPFASEFATLLGELKALGIPVVVIGPPVEVLADLPGFLARRQTLGKQQNDQSNVQVAMFEPDKILRDMTLAQGARYVSAIEAVCPRQVCDLYADPQTPLIWDKFHLTPEGASKVIGAIGQSLLTGLKPQ